MAVAAATAAATEVMGRRRSGYTGGGT